MTENYSKGRQAAEKAFGKTQAPLLAGDRAREEVSSVELARQEKTARLRQARLAKEAEDAAAGPAGSSGKIL